jgi:hypothetical protein
LHHVMYERVHNLRKSTHVQEEEGGIVNELTNPLNTKLNPICHLLALLGAYPVLYVSRIRVKCLVRQLIGKQRHVTKLECYCLFEMSLKFFVFPSGSGM